jgi:hypothetical protein
MPVNEDYRCYSLTQKKEVMQSTVFGAYGVTVIGVYAFPLSVLKHSDIVLSLVRHLWKPSS